MNGREPIISFNTSVSGREPSLGREARAIYGDARVPGLEAPEVPGRRRPLVVVATYDRSSGELTRLIATSNGYDVRVEPDGQMALSLVQALEPNLLVLSLRLLTLNGFDLMQAIRRDPNPLISHLPILVMSGSQQRQDVLRAFNCGADDYLTKPYEIPDMLRCWRRAASLVQRPTPLTALVSDHAMVRQVALAVLLKQRQPGLIDGLARLLFHPDKSIQSAVAWALRRIGTDDALSLLAHPRHPDKLQGKDGSLP
ncbi:MAG: response regulator [Chloroflexi bacterium]|nr:response regulator [Chloroflexota bacterium]